MKYGIWLDEWFRNYIQPSSKIKTCERYSEIIEKHLKVKLGEYELDELTPLVLQRYVTELMQSGNMTRRFTKSDTAQDTKADLTVIYRVGSAVRATQWKNSGRKSLLSLWRRTSE